MLIISTMQEEKRMNNTTVIRGYNDLATKRPDLIKYFVDQSIPYTIRPNSTKKYLLKCPDCGHEFLASPNIYYNRNFTCPKCSDGISYPNKFIYQLFDQLNIEYKPEYSPEWAGKKRYDIYFCLNNREYVVEADGGWHYIDNNLSGVTAEQTRKNDEYKELLLKKNGIELIRIDCRLSEKEYIRKNILDSDLSGIFNLDSIDWDKCDEIANKSILISICRYYDENDCPTREQMVKEFSLSKNTIASYLAIGRDLGICTYQSKDQKANQHYIDTVNYYNSHPKAKLAEMEKIIGVNRNRIADYLRRGTKEGLCKYLSKEEAKKEKVETIKKLLDSDPTLTPAQIISITGYPRTTTRRIIKELMDDGK